MITKLTGTDRRTNIVNSPQEVILRVLKQNFRMVQNLASVLAQMPNSLIIMTLHLKWCRVPKITSEMSLSNCSLIVSRTFFLFLEFKKNLVCFFFGCLIFILCMKYYPQRFMDKYLLLNINKLIHTNTMKLFQQILVRVKMWALTFVLMWTFMYERMLVMQLYKKIFSFNMLPSKFI